MKRLAASVAWMAAAMTSSGCAIEAEPIAPAVLGYEARAKLDAVGRDQEPFVRPVTVHEAMARAIKYNLEYKVEIAQTALKSAELRLANYSLLPEAVANSGYASRNNFSASSSFNLETNTPNFGASTSQDRHQKTADLSFSWHVLDFGLSYIRAQQAADRYLINAELQRRTTHRLLEDVRNSFWQAVSYEQLHRRMKRVEKKMKAAASASRMLADGGEASPMLALSNERELAEMKRTIKELERGISAAKSQLAALMNVAPGTPFELDLDSRPEPSQITSLGIDQLFEIAVRDRPELRENLYLQRINAKEARAALLELLPGLQLYATPEADSNSYLLNNDWVSIGAKASWNLIRLFQYPAKEAVIDSQQDVLRMRALAMTMAVVLQVNVSAIGLYQANEELAACAEHRSAQRRFMNQVRAEVAAGRLSEYALLREELGTLMAETKYDIAFARLQSAHSGLLTSIGAVPYGSFNTQSSIEELIEAMKVDVVPAIQAEQIAMQAE